MVDYTMEDLRDSYPKLGKEKEWNHYFIMNRLFFRFYDWLKKGSEPIITDILECKSDGGDYIVVIDGGIVKVNGLIKDVALHEDMSCPEITKISFDGDKKESVEKLEERFKEFIRNQELNELYKEAHKEIDTYNKIAN